MGSMADAVNAPEKKTEVSEALSHGATSVEEFVPGQVAVPALDFPANPKSPTELKEDQVGDEVDLAVQELPEKRARKSLEDELGKLMERTREGYDLTAAALDKVQQHLDISRQIGKDLAQLAQEVHCEKVGAKYQLAQLQQVLSSFQNLEWQVGGTKQESNTSIKAIANKLLSNATTSKEALKSIHAELREGNEKLIKAINDGFGTLAAAFTATSLPGKETAGSGFPPAPSPPSCTTSSTAGGTISDSDVWNARLCFQLCGCTAQYSSDTSSGAHGTIGIVDIYAPSSNCGSSGVE